MARAAQGRKPAGLVAAVLALALWTGAEARAAGADGALPVPRFVSLRVGEVNVRSGPGRQYPIDWVFKRRELPVEITAQSDDWRRIRDFQGTVGWVTQRALSARRTAIVTGPVGILRSSADPASATVAQLETGVVGRLLQCRDSWCRMEVDGRRGWIARGDIWGTYPQENFE